MANELEKRTKNKVKNTSAEQITDAVNSFSPDVDIYDTKDSLLFVIDLPGVSKGDVKVGIDENNIMSVRATTSIEEPGRVLMRESNIGNYYRAFSLSNEFNKDKVSAALENGVLEISIPRREEAKPRVIEISV
ncbi:MAG: hypothetical protein DKM50_00160 [Candidatus Margulisiibacteriota bacterium]|nr:MAG: hypothetical protein A2X43_02700 [Candidatus Margulisbacteria bacterium GWD2_39_127]OGI02743.1 MAG: hypothetical protein A2X42_01735 [Candidatus Margulisbacteria bacterium GWF2_38_17]OGI09371.1 MAG: hypothetical protein A2X41_09640 [Candidatus Margulisbacteria bacterium GWE2_39_32]PZM84948.1 MAG: hypothetical protein DKM50_00160 [Candidatus Margulisiibacteriota bacterium]HAR63645.1 hypothetical protein [Candidatus Margulisiibacteriota bacterium]